MFTDDKLYDKSAIARVVRRCTRTIDNWRERGLLPPPDVNLGGRFPAWWGKTLNRSKAFATPAETE